MQTKHLFLVMNLSFAALAADPGNDPAAAPPPAAPPKFSAADLEKLAAPIALHPDPLIAIILPASVYPLEIVQAARFVKNTNNLPLLDDQPWDENVRAVAKFPAMIQKMDEDLSWTSDLGEAFLDQQKELMDTIQRLRAKADSAGVLKTTPQQVVVVTNTVVETVVQQQVVYVTNTIVQIQPANPQVIYVPTYPYSIYYYYPPPVYVGPPPALTFAVGVTVGFIIANNCNWHSGGIYVGRHGAVIWGGGGYHGHGNVNVNVNRNVNINVNHQANINTGGRPTPYGGNSSGTLAADQKWQPDQSRLRSSGAPGSKASAQTADARGWSTGATQPTPAARAPVAATRPTAGPGAAGAPANASSNLNRPGLSPTGSRPAATPPTTRPAAAPANTRPASAAPRDSAFSNPGNGAGTRNSSNRGAASRGAAGGNRAGGTGRR